jgi:hypothetical protein
MHLMVQHDVIIVVLGLGACRRSLLGFQGGGAHGDFSGCPIKYPLTKNCVYEKFYDHDDFLGLSRNLSSDPKTPI